MATRPQPDRPRGNRGVEYATLEGADSNFRLRAPRRPASGFLATVTSECQVEGRWLRSLPVHDVSSNGIGIAVDRTLLPGTRLENFIVRVAGTPIWTGAAEVVHADPAGHGRVGCRLIGPFLDLEQLHFHSDELASVVVPALEDISLAEELPANWRALVLQYVRLFGLARVTLERAEQQQPNWRDPEISRALCTAVHDLLMPRAHEAARMLVQQADGFDESTRRIAADFSIPLIQEEYRHGEFLRRAFRKPLGYAGDYRMMEILQTAELSGETLYGRYLDLAAQENPMGVSVRRRSELVRSILRDACLAGPPLRVLSLACGPGMELRQLLREVDNFASPLEIVLVDQDEEALGACHQTLLRVIAERGDDPPVTISALHFSLRQLVSPRTAAEKSLVAEGISGIDFLYSMGLFDYLPQPIARRSLNALYRLLGPGGRMLIGNLQRVPESVWPMEFGADWPLVYRNQQDMLDLVSGLESEPDSVDMVRGAAHCLFLQVARG